jgi:release factor family 2
VLSGYLDMRPHATGESASVRAGAVILRNRLQEIEKTYLPRGPELDSIRADAERIDRYLAEEYDVAADGLALFACSGRDFFEAVEAGAPFEDQVTVAPQPDLFSARAPCRIDADSKCFRTRPMMGGLNQASYQRHNAALRAQFARETATELARFVDTEAASRVVLAGDEVAIPLLRDALSPQVGFGQGRATAGYSGPLDSVADDVKQVLAAAEAEDGQTTADLLVGAVRAGGLGVAGLDDTRVAQVGFPVVSDERRPLIGSI